MQQLALPELCSSQKGNRVEIQGGVGGGAGANRQNSPTYDTSSARYTLCHQECASPGCPLAVHVGLFGITGPPNPEKPY